jgi:hypothetical protein
VPSHGVFSCLPPAQDLKIPYYTTNTRSVNMEKFDVWKVKAACGGRTIYVDVRLGLTPTIALVVALMPCPHGLALSVQISRTAE